MKRPVFSLLTLAAGAMWTLAGCSPSRPFYLHDDGDLSHYKAAATQIEYPDVQTSSLAEVQNAQAPLTLANAEAREVWDLTLQEAVQNAVVNAKTLRSLGAQAFVPTTFAGGSRSAWMALRLAG